MHGASNMGHAINHLVVCAEDYFSLVKITCMLADSFVQWFLDNVSGSSKDAADTMMDGLSVLCVLFTPSFRYSSMPKPTIYQTSSSLLPVNNRCMEGLKSASRAHALLEDDVCTIMKTDDLFNWGL